MKVKNAMAIFAVLLIFGAVLVGSCSAQSSNDYLKIKGNIVNDHNADITVYSQDDSSDDWTKVDRIDMGWLVNGWLIYGWLLDLWGRTSKPIDNWNKISKDTGDFTKVNKEKEDWDKVEKE